MKEDQKNILLELLEKSIKIFDIFSYGDESFHLNLK